MSPKQTIRIVLGVALVLGFIAFQRSLSDGRSAEQVNFERWFRGIRSSPAEIALVVRGSRDDGPFEWQIIGSSELAEVSRATELAMVAKLFNLSAPKEAKLPPAQHVTVELISGASRFEALVPESAVSKNVQLQTFLRYVMEHATNRTALMARARGAAEQK